MNTQAFTFEGIQNIKKMQEEGGDDFMYRYYMISTNSKQPHLKISPFFKFTNAAAFIRKERVYYFLELTNQIGIETLYEETNVAKIQAAVQTFDRYTEFAKKWLEIKFTRDDLPALMQTADQLVNWELTKKTAPIPRDRKRKLAETREATVENKEEPGIPTVENTIDLCESDDNTEVSKRVCYVPNTPESQQGVALEAEFDENVEF